MSLGNWIEWIKVAISSLTLASIVVAYKSYRANIRKVNEDRIREWDRELLTQLQRSLQWAYDVLTDEGRSIPPRADRLNWLTTARHLLRARKISNGIISELYKALFAEIEEYWRHKFYLALGDKQLRNWQYYAGKSNPEWPENIEITSALVVVEFSNWKNGVPDPVDEVDRKVLMESGGLGGSAGRGLEGYIACFKEKDAPNIANG